MGNREFWDRLEYAATFWLQNSDERGLRQFWIDGFLPETVTNTKYGLEVQGVAWVGDPLLEYRFVASLPQKILHRKTPALVIEKLSLDHKQRVLHLLVATIPYANKQR